MNRRRESLLRLSGVLALLALLAVVGWSWSRVRDPFSVELGGTIDHYDEASLIVSTTTSGLRPITVTHETVVTESDEVVELSALRPGRLILVRGDVPGWGRPLVARTIMVWGGR